MRPRATKSSVALPVFVLLVAAGLRLWDLASPPQRYWDEQYYVLDAEVYLGGGIGQPIQPAPAARIANEGTWVHPPLGKWIIALLGVGPFGDRPIGWRLPSALFGVAGVALLYLLTLELWGSVWWAGFSALLLALDGLHIVQSRIATLDIFLTTFVTAGMLMLVLDRKRTSMTPTSPSAFHRSIDRVFGSSYRLGAGLAFGAAVATKWTGIFALVFAAGFCGAWLIGRSMEGSLPRWRTLLTVATSFVLAPLLVYLVAYGSFFYQHGPAIGAFVTLQVRMLQYHLAYDRTQAGNSLPVTWPLLLHPVLYFRSSVFGVVREVFAMGNPAIWWTFLALVPIALFTVGRKPTWQEVVAFGGYAALYLPWLVIHRSQFIFYMLPAVPFMCLAIVATLRRLPRKASRVLASGLACVAVIATVAFGPIWLGLPASERWIQHLRLLPSWRF